MSATIVRRMITLPALYLAGFVLTLATPVVLPLLGLSDLLSRGPSARARTYLLVLAYLLSEMGAVALAGAWVALGHGRDVQRFVRLQSWWTRTLLRVGSVLFRLRVVIEDDHVLAGAPMLLLMRHSSIGDTVLPSLVATQKHGVKLRYVLKKELLLDPALDIVGHRIVNHFVDREARDPAREREGIRGLVSGLEPDEGVVIYPEGTVYDEGRRRRALERLERRGDLRALERGRALRFVLPPRMGGTLSLLEANPGLDVVFCAHVGFEGAVGFKTLAAGGWLDRTIRVKFRRVPFAELPTDAEGRAEFLWSEWERMDREVAALHEANAAEARRDVSAFAVASRSGG